jgi:hypothetical protein
LRLFFIAFHLYFLNLGFRMVFLNVVVFFSTILAPFEHRHGLGGAAPYATNNEEAAKGNDRIDGTSGDITSISHKKKCAERANKI